MSPQELDGLLAAHFAGTLDAEGQKQLGEALLADESARRRFVELADQDMALRAMTEARQQAVPSSWFLVPGSGTTEGATSDEKSRGQSSVAGPDLGLSSAQPGTRNEEPGTPARRRSGWLLPAAAAAALIVVSGLFAFGILPSGNVTLKDFSNSSDRVRRETLADGTKLAIAPGAQLKAAGRDGARNVRQLIRLASGEVEVTAPKAQPGEVACRVETPEGLWVETVGTVFKVTRSWENEKGERNVDRSKLAGAAVAAVLLVAVSEGEVRTGTAIAEEAKVAAGESTALRASGDKGAEAGAVIRVGMSLKEAERILKAHGVRETDLAMAPPESPAGGFMTLKSYEVSADRAITVVADRKDGEAYVVELSVCDEMQAAQAERDWRKVPEIDVRPPPISWGQAVGGLQAGLSARQTRSEAGAPLDFSLIVRNEGKAGTLLWGGTCTGVSRGQWSFVFASAKDGTKFAPTSLARASADPGLGSGTPFPLYVEGGKQVAQVVTFGSRDRDWQQLYRPLDGREGAERRGLPAGRYTVTATYEQSAPPAGQKASLYWAGGKLVTGPVEIEIVAASGTAQDLSSPQKCWESLLAAMRAGNLEAIKACCTPEEAARVAALSAEPFRKERENFEYYASRIQWSAGASEESASAIVVPKAPALFMDFKKSGDKWLCAGASQHGANE